VIEKQAAHWTTQADGSRRILEYLLFLPADYYGDSERRWPLLLFLHGASERGRNVSDVKREGLPRRIAEGMELPFVVVAPQCPPGERWDVDSLGKLLDRVTSDLRIDRDRVYVTGLSMGGYGAWALAIARPERIAAIAPVCGGGSLGLADRLREMPVWTFHGALDDVVPLFRTEQMVDALRAAGGNVRFTIYPDLRHDSWTAAYDNLELYDWLLSHSLAERH
jgi:predicted peptidase